MPHLSRFRHIIQATVNHRSLYESENARLVKIFHKFKEFFYITQSYACHFTLKRFEQIRYDFMTDSYCTYLLLSAKYLWTFV